MTLHWGRTSEITGNETCDISLMGRFGYGHMQSVYAYNRNSLVLKIPKLSCSSKVHSMK